MKYCIKPVVKMSNLREAFVMQYGDSITPGMAFLFDEAQKGDYVSVVFDEEARADSMEQVAYTETYRPSLVQSAIAENMLLNFLYDSLSGWHEVLVHMDY